MWRIHFTPDDLTRVRPAAVADPMVELIYSLQILASQPGAVLFDPWRRHVRRSGIRRWNPLLTLAPAHGYFPDFLTPMAGWTDVEDSVDTILRTPRTALRHELSLLGKPGFVAADTSGRDGGGPRRVPDWYGKLANGEPRTLRGLGRLLKAYYDTLLAPHWPYVRGRIEDELRRLGKELLHGGVEGMMSNISSFVRWESSTLLLTEKSKPSDIYLNGRGLILLPSFFSYGDTVPFDFPDLPVVLTYPIEHEIGWFDAKPDAGTPQNAALRALLGRARSEALEVLAETECSTTELAARLDTALSTASQHAKVLREAGLVSSEQRSKATVHRTTTLGLDLLDRARIPTSRK